MPTTSFTQLNVWKRAFQVLLRIHRETLRFPEFERYELGRQMRRAALSIPSNIAEGYGRRRSGDKAYFYTVASGSNEELRCCVLLARELRYLKDAPDLLSMMDEVGRMLHRLIEATERGAACPLPPRPSAPLPGASPPPARRPQAERAVP